MTDTRPEPVAVLRGLLAGYEHKADAIRGALTLLGDDAEPGRVRFRVHLGDGRRVVCDGLLRCGRTHRGRKPR